MEPTRRGGHLCSPAGLVSHFLRCVIARAHCARGERTERCRWQRKRSERVAAVKILSVRRKAAQKFWAPQQDHRPLRKHNKRCGKTGRRGRRPLRTVTGSAVRGKNPPVTASPCQPPLGKGGEGTGMRIATTSLRTGLAMTWFIMGESHLVGGWLMPVGGGKACIRSCWWRMTGP